MGKDKTDTILLNCPNIKNDKKKFIEDKENSIKSNKSIGPPKFSLRVRTDLTAEVLEEENSNDSGSTNSKSNKSSSTSPSEETQNSSSTSNKEKSNRSDVKSLKKDKNISENEDKEDNTTQFRIASENPTGFKLRIVPLEKLLEKPPPPAKPVTPPAKAAKKERIPAAKSRRLPQRRSKPVTFIELSDSEEEEEDSESDTSESVKIVKKGSGRPKRNSKTKLESEEDDEPKRRSSKRKPAKNSSDSEENVPKRSNSTKKQAKKAFDSEEDSSIKSKSKKKNSTKENSTDSEEDEPIRAKSKDEGLKGSPDIAGRESKSSKNKNKSAEEISEHKDGQVKAIKLKIKNIKEICAAEGKDLRNSKTGKKSLKETSSESEKDQGDSEEDEPKSTKSTKNLTGSEEKELEKSKTKKKTAKVVSSESEKNETEKSTSDSEKSETKYTKSKKKLPGEEEKELKKSKTNKKTTKEKTSSDSESDEPQTESSGSKEEGAKTQSNKKSVKESSDSEKPVDSENRKAEIPKNEKKSTKVFSETDEDDRINLKVSSESEQESNKSESKKKLKKGEENDQKKLKSKPSKSSKDCSESESSDSEQVKNTSSKRKRIERSSDSDEEKLLRRKAKRNPNRESVQEPKSRQLSKESNNSSSDFEQRDINETVKQKSKSKKILGPPPSPSTVRSFVVRVKRSKLSDFKDLCKNKSKRNMNGRGKSEKPSTSRRKHESSDEDSDYDFRKAAIADHDYDARDVDEDDDDDDKASQKSSDSEIIPTRKRRVFHKNKNKSDNSDSDFEPKQQDKKKKRRVKRNSTDDSDDDDKKKSNRKDIRKIIKSDDLNLSTKEAAKQEQERRKRIEERQKLYNQIYEKPDSIEVTELVLDFDTDDATTLLEVDKGLMKKLKPHQVTGVKFMWDACFETIKDAQEKPGSGCILAHCMGLGKTMQIVTLSHTLLANSRKTNVERVLIISPLSTLNNWAREFKHWISFTKKRNIEVYDMSKYKDKTTRIFKLNEWVEEGGVCIMGYDMYRILANEKAKGLKKKQREQLQQSLVDPGPDLVVCDEGHLLKNEKTSISKAVTRMRTQRRIVLTGTPLQNNLKEYYCMIQFIKPNLLGTYKEYLNRFVNPISNGQYTDSTDRDIRLMKHRSHILHKLLEGCIQRRDYSVLAPYLPPKHEYVVYTTLSVLQQLLYEHYMVNQRDSSVNSTEGKGAKLFQDFQELRRIWTHPMNMRINSDSVIRKKILANESDSMDDFICDDDEARESSSDSSDDSSKSFGSGADGAAPSKVLKTRNYRRKAQEEGIEIESDIEEVVQAPKDDPSEWWKRFVADKELNNINHSPKLVILMRLLEQCEAIGDKLLVFSQSLQSLDTIEHFLSLVDSKTRGYEYEGDVGDLKGFWKPGTDYFRLDGSCSVEQRESMCKKFNDACNLRARLFLISTRAGGLGINLVSANRVVIFDVSWNPSHDTQSIFRVYRFGQIKPCYIYRLIAMGTMEQKLYERQVAKQATAKRVIDEQQISRHYNQSDLQELYTYELKPSVEREIPLLPKDRLFAELLTEHESLLFKYHEHDSLLENEESENLSAEERSAAWTEYEAEKTRAVQTAQYVSYDRSAYGQYGNSSGSVTSNKIFGFRSDVLLQLLNMKIAKDHPEMNQNQVIQVVPTYLNELYSQMNSGDPSMYKDLLTLHATLTHPSGMYMNPLLYVNQNPSAAGYFQAGGQPPNGAGVVPIIGGPVMVPGGVPMMRMAGPAPVAAPGFDPNEVYEID